jgi:hypothetical protein
MMDATATSMPSTPGASFPPVVERDSKFVNVESTDPQNLNHRSRILSHGAHERQGPSHEATGLPVYFETKNKV